MMRASLVMGLMLLAMLTIPQAFAQQVAPVCTENSRACLLRTVSIYLDGLARNDASAIPFAPKVRCTEQGNVEVTDETTFRHELSVYKVHLGTRNVRLLIDDQAGSVSAFYLLDIGTFEGKPPFTVRRGQRFKVVEGLITEVEVYNFFDRRGGKLAAPLWPDSPATVPAAAGDAVPFCTGSTRACYARIVRAYFDAILNGRVERVPFAANVRVTEQNHIVATSRAAFLEEFKSTGATKRLRNLRMLIDTSTGQVAVLVLADVRMAGKPPFTVRRIQRLKIERGLITEVELVIYLDDKPAALWPDEADQ